jgi:hypothetical protein
MPEVTHTNGCCGLDELHELWFGSKDAKPLKENNKAIADALDEARNDIGYEIATFATTVPKQRAGIAALKANGFKRVTRFFNPGHNSIITLWLRRSNQDPARKRK